MKKIFGLILVLLITVSGYTFWKNQGALITTPPAPQQSSPVAKDAGIVLRHDGLEILAFGTPEKEVIETLTSVLGEPTRDTGWVDSFSTYGLCPGEKMRGVEWGSLHVFIGDTREYGNKTFFGYEYVDPTGLTPPSFMTDQKITLGASKEAIVKAYPNATFGEWLPGQTGTTFVRGPEGTSGQYLGGTLENNKLFWIGGGVLCGE